MIVCIKFLDYTHQKYKKFMLDEIVGISSSDFWARAQ